MTENPTTGRSPLAAVVLSLLATGLGHLYSGQIGRGLGLFLVSLAFGPVIAAAAFLGPSTALLAGICLTVLVVLGVYVFAVADAYRLARRSRTVYQLREYNRPIVYVVFIVVGLTYPLAVGYCLRATCFEPFLIPTRSEVPNFLPGDHILVNKMVFQWRFPQRGDMVVFHHHVPEGQRTWIKRVIGLPGDTVAVHDGAVILNGKPLERDRVPPESLPGVPAGGTGAVYEESNSGARYRLMLEPVTDPIPDFPEQKVPQGQFFVLGDNRNLSRDSRAFGFVPQAAVIGQVQYIYWPAESWRRFGACR